MKGRERRTVTIPPEYLLPIRERLQTGRFNHQSIILFFLRFSSLRVPQLSWSLSRDDTPPRPKDLEPLIPPEDPTFERRPSLSSEDSSSPAFRPSQSTSQLPNPSGDTSAAPHRATQSTSRLPFLPLNNGTQHKTS